MSERIKLPTTAKWKGDVHTVSIEDTATPSEAIPSEKELGYQEGYQIGYQQAQKEAFQKIQQIKEQLAQQEQKIQQIQNEIVRELQEAWENLKKDLARQTVEMSVVIAEHLIQREISVKSMTKEIIESELKEIGHTTELTIYVSQPEWNFIHQLFGNRPGFSVVADNTLSPGEIIFASDLGYGDGRLLSRLNAIREQLHNLLEEGKNSNDLLPSNKQIDTTSPSNS